MLRLYFNLDWPANSWTTSAATQDRPLRVGLLGQAVVGQVELAVHVAPGSGLSCSASTPLLFKGSLSLLFLECSLSLCFNSLHEEQPVSAVHEEQPVSAVSAKAACLAVPEGQPVFAVPEGQLVFAVHESSLSLLLNYSSLSSLFCSSLCSSCSLSSSSFLSGYSIRKKTKDMILVEAQT